MNVNILTKGLQSYNGIAFLTPLILNQQRLKEIDIEIKFFTKITKKITDCDILILESKFFVEYWHNTDKLFTLLQSLKKQNKLYFFDLGDSSSSWTLGVLPYVDRMYKSYLLKDKKTYTKELYGGRLWTDYYHQEFDVEDENNNNIPKFYANKENLDKIHLSYSAALGNYSLESVFWQDNLKAKLAKRLWWLRKLSVKKTSVRSFTKPSIDRKVDLSARMSVNGYNNTVSYQRVETAYILEKFGAPSDKLNRYQYMEELANSKIVASPFGWGEFNYKDYEVAMAGAVLLKPNISHIQTWPNIFSSESVVQYTWDFSDLTTKIENIIDNYGDYLPIATKLQDNYKYYISSTDGQEEFCQYFKKILE